MKKNNLIFALLCVTMLFSGCAFNRAPFQDYPVVTQVQLNQANYRVVKEVHGYSEQLYVFGIGGFSQKSLYMNAISDMYENANLQGSQAIANVTTALSVSSFFPFYSRKRASASGIVIEFLSDSGKPVASASSIEKKEDTHGAVSGKLMKEEANKCYIAWLLKENQLINDKKLQEELYSRIDKKEVLELEKKYSANELLLKSEGHDTDLYRYAK